MLPRIRNGLVALVIIFVQLAAAASFTVDDADPGITYSAVSDWNIGNRCSGCFAQPTNLASINGRTWHDSTRGPNASEIWFEYSFRGTSLTVYGILIDIVITEYLFIANTDLTLTLDGETTTFTHNPANSNSYQYQVPVFSKRGLSDTTHTARVTLNPSSAFLFDNFVYTTADTTSSSSSTSSSGTSSTSGTTTSGTSGTSQSPSASSGSSSGAVTTFISTRSLTTIGGVSISTDSSGATHTIATNMGSTDSSASSSPPLGMILGIVGGIVGLLLIAILVLVFLLCHKRRNSRQNTGPQAIPPSTINPISDPLMQTAGPSTFPQAFANSTSKFHSTHGNTPFSSSHNLSAVGGGANEPAAVAAAAAMNSKQRRMQQEQVYLPTQQPQPHQDPPAWVTGRGSGGASAYSGGSAVQSSVYDGMDGMSSHTGPMTSASGSTDYNYDASGSTPLSRCTAPGVGGRTAPWNTGLYTHSVTAPASLVAPMPVPLGAPLGNSDGSESRSRSATSGVTRPPTPPPPYIRSPPPLNSVGRDESGHGTLRSVSEYDEKR